jgi:nucleotide-binding universal stress UspA family protein
MPVPPERDYMKKVLIYLDYNENGEFAARKGILLARKIDADVILLHTVTTEFIKKEKKDPDAVLDARRTKIRRLVRKLMSTYNCTITAIILEGAPEEKIIEFAQSNKVNAIVMNIHHRVKSKRRRLHESAKNIIHRLEIPVVTISSHA